MSCCSARTCLDEIGNVHRHLLDLSAVELLDLAHHADVISSDEVDGNTLPAESATTTDTVNVVLTVGGQIVVDDQGNLLNIDTTGEKISGDENTRRSRAELFHDDIALSLLHVTVHGRNGEVASSELVSEPVDLSASVAEDDSLGNGDSLVQVGKGVELPLLLLNSNVELLDTFKRKLGLLDQDTDGVAHELGGNLEHILRHGGGEENNLGRLGKKLEDVVDLLGETTGQHLVSLVQNEHLDVVGLEHATLDHVLDATRGSNNDLRAVLQSFHVLTNIGAANAGVALNVHEVANGNNDFLNLLGKLTSGSQDQSLASLEVLVNLLEGGDREGSGLAGTGLSLSNDIGAYQLVRQRLVVGGVKWYIPLMTG